MKKIITIFVPLFLLGCANTHMAYQEARIVDESAISRNYKAEPVGILKWNNADHCSEVHFIKYAMERNLAHNIVNIVMEETCVGEGIEAQCECSYVGFGEKFVKGDLQDPSSSSSSMRNSNYNKADEPKINKETAGVVPEQNDSPESVLTSEFSSSSEAENDIESFSSSSYINSMSPDEIEHAQNVSKKQQQSLKRRIEAAKSRNQDQIEKEKQMQKELGNNGNDSDYKKN